MATPDPVFAPGRVNLIGDHTDYNAGVALPMAVQLGVTVTYVPTDDAHLDVSSTELGRARVPLGGRWDADADRAGGTGADGDVSDDGLPPWARLIAAVADLARPESGGRVSISSSLPTGAGLSSSAALTVALARAFGVEGSPVDVARLCQAAEHRIGAPVGLMDPWVCAGGRAGHALLLDFAATSARPVTLPAEAEWVVIDSGQPRSVRTSDYLERVAECEAATALIGPLGAATSDDLVGIRDARLRRRARHVVTECARVRTAAAALVAGDLPAVGQQMWASHRSLSSDFEVSTPELDELADELSRRPGVLGARLTGAGFGGCLVVLGRAGGVDASGLGRRSWRVSPSAGAYVPSPASPG
ncbi:MAG: hypothetical protein JO368_09085 [Acidimicrobiales bacterium]|nr:hypothetical protein [Acidimicrobiales bacterium]